MFFKGNQYLDKKLFLKLILYILNDEDSFTELYDELYDESLLIIINGCFLLVLANIM